MSLFVRCDNPNCKKEISATLGKRTFFTDKAWIHQRLENSDGTISFYSACGKKCLDVVSNMRNEDLKDAINIVKKD